MASLEPSPELRDRDPFTRPPVLRRVQIRGYKSIAFCDVSLEPLTVLVGRNGAGKSNFLDALGFLRDVSRRGVAEAVTEHGGVHAIRCAALPLDRVDFAVEFSPTINGESVSGSYSVSLSLGLSSDEPPRLIDEKLPSFVGYDVPEYYFR
jgi:hypothetical protein